MSKRLIILFMCFLLVFTVSCGSLPTVQTFATRQESTGPAWFPSVYPTETERTVGVFGPRHEKVVVATDLLLPDWSAPFRALSSGANGPIRLIYETLVEYDYALQQFSPALATSWSGDAAELVIKLPTDRSWHDGTLLTVADVIYTIELKQRIEAVSAGVSEVPAIAYNVTEVDASTVRITYADPAQKQSILWELANLLIVPKHIFLELESHNQGEHLSRIADPKLIGSGPYKHATDDDFVVRLRATEEGVPPVVEIPRYGDDKSRVEAFTTGRADFYYGEQKMSEAVDIFGGREMLYGIFLNAERLPLRDLVVRKALLSSIRGARIAGALREEEVDISPFQYYLDSSRVETLDKEKLSSGVLAYDPDHVKTSMENAGYKQSDGYYTLKGESVLTVVYVGGRREETAMTLLKDECRAAGFRLELKSLSPVAYAEARRNRSFDLALDIYAVGDSADILRERISSLSDAFTRKESVSFDQAEADKQVTLQDAVTAEGTDKSSRDTELVAWLQSLSVFLPLGSRPERFLNVRHDYWQGDLSFLGGAGVWSDPFGPKALTIFRHLKPTGKTE